METSENKTPWKCVICWWEIKNNKKYSPYHFKRLLTCSWKCLKVHFSLTPSNNKWKKSPLRWKKLSEKTRKKMSTAQTWRKQSEETKRKLSEYNTWRKRSTPAWNKWKKWLCGKDNPNWKWWTTLIKDIIRHTFEYRQWRSDVYTRDWFTCQECWSVGWKLNAHHIVPFSEIIIKNNITWLESAKCCEELWNINNWITLCVDCHTKTDSFWKKNV